MLSGQTSPGFCNLLDHSNVIIFIMLYKVILTLKSVDQGCDRSNESYWQYFHVVLFSMLYKGVLTFKSVDETLVCDHSNESY